MRVMVVVKATENSEAGILPGDPRAPAGYDNLFEQMGKFNEELVKAGVMLAGEGLRPSSKGKRVVFSSGKKTIVDGCVYRKAHPHTQSECPRDGAC